MTREEMEKSIGFCLQDIWDEYKKYNPDGKYLSLAIMEDDDGVSFQANNECWEACDGDPAGADYEKPIRFTFTVEVENA